MSKLYRSIRRRIDQAFGIRKSSYPYMSGDSFRAVAQHVYGDPDTGLDPARVKSGDVVFVKADKVADFMRDVHPRIAERYVVISHNSDAVIDASWLSYIEDSKIIRWFGQNAMVSHQKLVPVPIGLENLHWHTNGEVSLFESARREGERKTVFKKFRMLYAFTVGTNPAERQPALESLARNDMADDMKKARGTDARPEPPEYVKALNGYAIVASPPGNGTDCHRTWEALYLGVLPIVKRSPATEYFRSIGLPLWVIDSWDEVPNEVRALRARYDAVWSTASVGALWMDYWIKEIDDARHEA